MGATVGARRRPTPIAPIAPIAALAAALVGGCILEDNPRFGDADGSTSGTTTTAPASVAGDNPTSESESSSTSGNETSASSRGVSIGLASDSGASEGSGDEPPLDPCPPERCVETHVGLTELGCDRTEQGEFVESCAFFGSDAIAAALAEPIEAGLSRRIVVHDDHGEPAYYRGGLSLGSNTAIDAANDTRVEDIIVHEGSAASRVGAIVHMRGDHNRIRGLTLVCEYACLQGIRFETSDDEDAPVFLSGGHTLENLRLIAIRPEVVGANSVSAPFDRLGPDTVLRNTHVWGYWEGAMDLTQAHRSAIHHSTFAWYQHIDDTPFVFDARGTQDLEIANNVFMSLSAEFPLVVQADDATAQGVFAGNWAEGFASAIGGIPDGDPQNMIEGNVLGPLPLESPHRPHFLNDADAPAPSPGSHDGTSLDGIPLDRGALPGAYQIPSSVTSPRATILEVGSSCASDPSCIDSSIDNALQVAVWSAWPGATIRVHPGTYNAIVIGRPLSVEGVGDPGEVQLRFDPTGFYERVGMLQSVRSVIRVLQQLGEAVVLRDMTLQIPPGFDGVVVEPPLFEPDASMHLVERLHLLAAIDDAESLAHYGAMIGDATVLRDSLIAGGLSTCVGLGPRISPASDTPSTTVRVVNLTCRLQSVRDDQRQTGFDVASTEASAFINVIVELSDAHAPLFRAQRRSADDTGVVALDLPASFRMQASTLRGGAADLFEGFTEASGDYSLDVTRLETDQPLFVSAEEAYLVPSASAIDAGVDPQLPSDALPPSLALDGVERTQRVVDQGCYEQGD